jgi:hypothetical protein
MIHRYFLFQHNHDVHIVFTMIHRYVLFQHNHDVRIVFTMIHRYVLFQHNHDVHIVFTMIHRYVLFQHNHDVHIVFTSICLIYVICVCLRIVVSNIYCVVLFFFVLCTWCCPFLWIVYFWLSLRYSPTFIY